MTNRSPRSPGSSALLKLAVPGLVTVLPLAGLATASSHGSQAGEEIFMRSCIACHGTDGAGAMPGIPDLSGRDGPLGKSDAALVKSILEGIASDRAPTPMPPKGGDDALTEADARMVLDYMRRRFGPIPETKP